MEKIRKIVRGAPALLRALHIFKKTPKRAKFQVMESRQKNGIMVYRVKRIVRKKR